MQTETKVPTLQQLDQIAEEIRELQSGVGLSLWDIAEKLVKARKIYPAAGRGNTWSEWLWSEFKMSARFALDLMGVHKKFEHNPEARKIPISVLTELVGNRAPKALVNEVLSEADNPPTRREVRIRKQGTYPSPSEARKKARDSGKFIIASDGNVYSGATEQESDILRDRRRQTYAVLDAITLLADIGITPRQWLSEAPSHQLHSFRLAALDAALEWLAALKPGISEKLGVIENVKQED